MSPRHRAPLVELRDVTVRIGEGSGERAIVDGVSLALYANEFVAVMGPSGSGKSTMLSLIGGLASPTSGEVLVHGKDVARMDADERAALRLASVGYVFQDFNLIPALTASENVALPLELAGLGSDAASREAAAALSRVGLDGMGARFPDDLSGGERQRVAIARASIGHERIILADEPTGALDSVNALLVLELLRDIGSAGLVVTHDPAIAERLDRVVHLRDGRVVEPGPAPVEDVAIVLGR